MDPVTKYNAIAQANAANPQAGNWQQAFAHFAPQPKKKRGLLQTLAPAIGGGLAGLAAAPFTGGLSLAATIAAVGGASALGGAAGEFGAQKSNHEQTNVGNILKEGALSGAFGAGGEAFTGLKIAKAAGEAAGEGGNVLSKIGVGLSATDGGRVAADAAGSATRGATQRTVDNLFGDATGVKAGGSGAKLVTPQQASELQDFLLKDVKVPRTANANQVLEHTANFKTTTGKAIADTVEAGNRAVTSVEKNAIIDAIKTDAKKIAGFDITKSAEAKTLIKQISSANTLSELNDLRQGADALQNFARSGTAKVPGLERVAQSVRTNIDKLTAKEIEGLKPLQTAYSRANRVLDLAGPAAKSPTGISFGAFKLPGGAATQSLKAGAATGIRGAGDLAGTIAPLVRAGATQIIPRALGGDYASPADAGPQDLGTAVSNAQSGDYGAPTNSMGMSSLASLNSEINDAIRADLAQTGGKNVSNLLAYQKFYSENIASNGGSTTKLTANQQTNHDNLQSALASLQAASENFDAAGGAKGPIQGELAKIPLFGQYINAKGSTYEKSKTDTALTLAKALTNSARAPQAVFDRVFESLPDISDRPEVIQTKLSYLYNQILKQAQAHGFDDVAQQVQAN